MATDITKSRDKVIRPDLNFNEKLQAIVLEAGPFLMMVLVLLTLWQPLFFEATIPLYWLIYRIYQRKSYPEGATEAKRTDQKPSASLFCMGFEVSSKQPVWFSDTQMRQHMLVMGTTGAGKAQPLDALVHTPTGWVKMGSIHKGAAVSTPDGKSSTVLGVFPQGIVPIYRVRFEDGRVTEACGNHLWEINHKKGARKSSDGFVKPRTMNTLEVQKLLKNNKEKISVRLTQPLHKESADIPIDAYLIGVLIRDSDFSVSSNKPFCFPSKEPEILDRVQRLLPIGVELCQSDPGDPSVYYLVNNSLIKGDRNVMRMALENAGFLSSNSSNNFIPPVYLEADVNHRWALLQGLMDADGINDKSNSSIIYTTVSENLACNVQTLVRSLGGIAKIISVHEGAQTFVEKVFTVEIRLPHPHMAFSLSLKQETSKNFLYADALRLGIESVEYIGDKEAQCIYIDHVDHLYVTDEYVVTHNTELLLYLSAQAMAQGSGVIYVDGKGDVKTWFRLFSIAKRLGVEENLRVLNFGTNRKRGDIKYDLSNTIQPFTLGDAGQLAEMMSALMAEAGGDGGMWKGRAESMMRALLTALVDLRDLGVLDLGPNALADNMPLDKFAALEKDPRISALGRLEIQRYLDSLPGFRAGGQGKAEADKQHGFLTMQFTEILGLFNNAYGHIMAFPLGEIDMYDVIVNRRCLYVMLPSMEKSSNSVKNLGKIVVNQIRAALSKTLGSGIKGSKAEKLEARPTNSKTPMLCILDEYGSYAVEGFGEVAAQARSIGFSTIFAVQDWASLEKADSRGNEAQRIWANTNIKIIMKVEDSKSTMPLVLERIKEGYVLKDQGKEYNDSGLGGLRNTKTLSYQEVKRLDPNKLFTLSNGRMFVIHQDRFHEVQATYLPDDTGGWANVNSVGPGRLLPLAPPSMEQIASEVAMSRHWGFAGENTSTDIILDSDIPAESDYFRQSLLMMAVYPDEDPTRQGLEFVRVYLRTALQAAAKEAHKLFSGASSSDSDDSPYANRASARPQVAAVQHVGAGAASGISWSAPISDDTDLDTEDFDNLSQDGFGDEGDPYIVEDFDSDDTIDAYPELQNESMPHLERKEYVGGALEITEDPDGEYNVKVKRVERLMKGRQGDDDDDEDTEDADGGIE
jgi:intein/homing endonuclease